MSDTINWSAVAVALQAGLGVVEQLAPLAVLGGPQAGAIGNLAAGAAGVAESLLSHASDARTVIASSDLAQIQTITAALQAKNDEAAARIAAS